MIKPFVIFLLCVLFYCQGLSQDNYNEAMKQAQQALDDSNYPSAIKLYNAAKAFDPSQSAAADKKIDSVFGLILQQKIEAVKNRDSARKETARADANLKVAANALKISHANQIMYEAQGVVKLDPALALHLAAAALDSIKNITMDDASIDDSLLLVDKANRIYYENNFGQTAINDQSKITGRFSNAIFWPDENSIWTLTDKFYGCKWNNGKLATTIKLDTSYKEYTTKILGKDSLLIFGIDRGTATRKKSIKVWVITNKKSPSVYTDSSNNTFVNFASDLIWLNTTHDQSEGWAKRLFVFDDRVFQFNSDGKLALIDSVKGDIRHIAFSPDGKLIAITNSKRALRIFNTDGVLLDSNNNIGDNPDNLEFSPDNKMLLVKQANSLQFFNVPDLRPFPTLYFTGTRLQSYQFSSDADGRWLLVSALSGNQQVINLYIKSSSKFSLYAQFKCPGSVVTSAIFSKDNKSILSSSDKIRLWKIPSISSEPNNIETNSEFISSVQFDPAQYNLDSTFTAVTFNDKILRYKYYLDGSTESVDSSSGNQQPGVFTTRLCVFLPYQRTLIVSEDGQLQLYTSKDDLKEFLRTFHFDEFTEEQKKRYGLEN